MKRSYCKLTSKVQNLVEMEHLTVKNQQIATQLQQLVGMAKILHTHTILPPPPPEILNPPLLSLGVTTTIASMM